MIPLVLLTILSTGHFTSFLVLYFAIRRKCIFKPTNSKVKKKKYASFKVVFIYEYRAFSCENLLIAILQYPEKESLFKGPIQKQFDLKTPMDSRGL